MSNRETAGRRTKPSRTGHDDPLPSNVDVDAAVVRRPVRQRWRRYRRRPRRACSVALPAGPLADFDEVAVWVAHVAAQFVTAVGGRCQEVGPARTPLLVDGV